MSSYFTPDQNQRYLDEHGRIPDLMKQVGNDQSGFARDPCFEKEWAFTERWIVTSATFYSRGESVRRKNWQGAEVKTDIGLAKLGFAKLSLRKSAAFTGR
jgi:hypothetical protein